MYNGIWVPVGWFSLNPENNDKPMETKCDFQRVSVHYKIINGQCTLFERKN